MKHIDDDDDDDDDGDDFEDDVEFRMMRVII